MQYALFLVPGILPAGGVGLLHQQVKHNRWHLQSISHCFYFMLFYSPKRMGKLFIKEISVYDKGKGGGGVERERRLEGQQITKLGRKYQHD
jgi:hypothetical protein